MRPIFDAAADGLGFGNPRQAGRSGQVGGWLLRTVQLSSSARATMMPAGPRR